MLSNICPAISAIHTIPSAGSDFGSTRFFLCMLTLALVSWPALSLTLLRAVRNEFATTTDFDTRFLSTRITGLRVLKYLPRLLNQSVLRKILRHLVRSTIALPTRDADWCTNIDDCREEFLEICPVSDGREQRDRLVEKLRGPFVTCDAVPCAAVEDFVIMAVDQGGYENTSIIGVWLRTVVEVRKAESRWCFSIKVEAPERAVLCWVATDDPVAAGDGTSLSHLGLSLTRWDGGLDDGRRSIF